MKELIGILTENSELLEDFKSNYAGSAVVSFKSFDSIRRDDFTLFAIDSELFDSVDLIQFYLSKIRKKIQDTPVILILKINILNELKWDWFFDDFILYPFRKGELSSRIQKLHIEKGISGDNILIIGHLKLNLSEYTAYHKNTRLELTYKEFELLRLLIQNRGVVFSRKDLLNKIWGMEYIGGTRTVDVHIRRLRGKLGDEFNSIIETVRNVGYRCIE